MIAPFTVKVSLWYYIFMYVCALSMIPGLPHHPAGASLTPHVGAIPRLPSSSHAQAQDY